MTQIAYMSGIKADPSEYAQRAALIVPQQYIPFTRLTRGEMELALARENLEMDARYYPESRDLQKAVQMIDNALYGGISGGVHFVGAINDQLQPVARLIDSASRQNRPASGWYIPRVEKGVRIGDPLVPVKYSGKNCKDVTYDILKGEYEKYKNGLPNWKAALLPPFPPRAGAHTALFNYPIKSIRNKYQELYLACTYGQAVEEILNTGLEKASTHMLYHQVPAGFEPAVGTLVATKRLLHRAAGSDLGSTAKVDTDLMRTWIELGQKRTALATGQFTPNTANSAVMSAMLSPNPDLWANKMIAEIKKRGGASVGEPITLAAITALVVAIGSALTAAAKLKGEFQAKQITALQNAQGFGSDAFSPDKTDFMTAKGNTTLTPPSDNNNLLLIGGAAAALYLLTK